MLKPFKRLCQLALGWVLPPTCPGCNAPLPHTEPVGFCAICYARLPWWNTARIMPPKLPPAINGFTAPCLYQEPMRSAIHAIKFHDAIPYIKPLAKLLVPYVPRHPVLIVPVPSHASRIRSRKYNHAAMLAQHLSALTGQPCDVFNLKRIKKDTPQAAKTRAARLKLPSTAFHAHPTAFQGRHIILLDDIYTTGATTRACALCLRKAGAASIHVLTLAYTAPD